MLWVVLALSCTPQGSTDDTSAVDSGPPGDTAVSEDSGDTGDTASSDTGSNSEPAPAAAAFSEVTAAAGIDFVHLAPDGETGGGAVADFDSDGWLDIYAVSGGASGAPDALYINNRDGTFTDRAADWGLTEVHWGRSAVAADLDDDGWTDLYVTSGGAPDSPAAGEHRIYRNTGGSGFERLGSEAGASATNPFGSDGFGIAVGDYDLDGDIDLFVTGATESSIGNRLFENNGSATFFEATSASGILAEPGLVGGYSALFHDMDGDRYPELLWVADFGNSRYFCNDADGTFTDCTTTAAVGHEENGMGGVVADLDDDGDLDWYVTSVFNGTVWTGNKLYSNQGSHTYVEEADSRGPVDGGWGWGVLAIDVNHDGRLDLLEVNGAEPVPEYTDEQSYLWVQQPDGTFDEGALAAGLDAVGPGRGASALDYDRDGDLDVVVFNNDGPLQLYRNDVSGDAAHWLTVSLDTRDRSDLAPHGLGAEVRATVAGRVQLRTPPGGASFVSQTTLELHFGLGSATTIDQLEVAWPDGTTTALSDVDADQHLTLAAPAR